MTTKVVVIVENDAKQRNDFQKALTDRGFRAQGAATVAEAFRILEELGEATDVMMLDMALDDPDAPMTTGADIALQLRDRHPDWLPEYVIKTGYSLVVNFYRLALRLGAAAYLVPGEVSPDDMVRHIRVLALKRALRIERPQVMGALSLISESTKSLSEAVKRFCQRVLAEEFDSCLGTPYVLLLTDQRGTQNVATNTNLPKGYHSAYAAIQSKSHAIAKQSSSHLISQSDTESLFSAGGTVEEELISRLPGAALVSVARVGNFRLSLILLAAQAGESKYPEEIEPLALILCQHWRPSIIEHFLGILISLDAQRHAMLKSTSYLCLYVGQEQERILNEATAHEELKETSNLHHSLAMMADDFRLTGVTLNSAANNFAEPALTIDMRDMVQREIEGLKSVPEFEKLDLQVDGSCFVRAGEDLAIAVRRLLQWLAQRGPGVPPGQKPQIHVRCAQKDDASEVIFEDRSRRLSPRLRARLFEPFSTSIMAANSSDCGPGLHLPLYLAKVLVEEKYGGELNDESDHMGGDVGHRLVMWFRLPHAASASVPTKE